MSLCDESNDFELVDSLEVAKQIIADKQPDISKVQAWLSPTDYNSSSSEFHRHLSSKAPETGEWIRETSQFNQWHSSEYHGSIWIKAVPGAGKSVVAASMVDSLSRNESVPVLHFFFRQIIETNRSSRSLLQDWLSQLLPFSEILQVSLWEHLEENKALASLSTSQLWQHLLSGLRYVERAYCVVDALDEMTIDEDFLSRLNALGSFRPAHIKIIMTSRPKQYLQRALTDPQVIHVSLEEELVSRDISTFILQRVGAFGEDGVDVNTQKSIIDTICKRSDGLFLYARLILDQIAKSVKANGNRDHSIQQMVAQLPVGLEDMYNMVLFDHATLTKVDQSTQAMILQLASHSARPLRLIEIANALETNVRFEPTSNDIKEVIRSACGPLLEIMEDETVQILHHSFTEFLLNSSRLDRSTPEAPHFPVIDSTTAHRDIALTCFASLQFEAFQSYPEDPKPEATEFSRGEKRASELNFRAIFLQHPFVEYGARNWPYHVRNYEVEDPHFFNSCREFCDPSSPHFRAWLELLAKDKELKVARRHSTSLHIAASFGLTLWAKHLIEIGMDIDGLDSSENTPLFWAAKSGYSDMVDLLLRAGAKPDVDGYDGLKPLHVAALRNHSKVVKLILAAGVPPTTRRPREVGHWCGNARRSIGEHPLMYACGSGHTETVLEMIPYAKPGDLEQALCWTAEKGHSQLISALFEKSDVSPNATAEFRALSINHVTGGASALMLAVGSLDPECVRILLEKGASVQQKEYSIKKRHRGLARVANSHPTPNGRTPLHSIARIKEYSKAYNAAKSILDMLLAAGADLEAKDSEGNTPLLLTIDNSSNYSVSMSLELLLSAGADPGAIDSNGETILHRACKSMVQTKAASLLLDYKAAVGQPRSSDGATPLHCTAENNHAVEHIQLLVAHGADINARDFNGNTLLHSICKGHLIDKSKILDAMLQLGVDVNQQNNQGQTCLHLLDIPHRDKGEADRVGAIIAAGADLEIRDREGMTVLLNAVAKNPALAEVLLRQPKLPSLSARMFLKGKTVLHLACQSKNPLGMIQLLVSKGADVNWTDNEGNTLLHDVAERFEGRPEQIALVEQLVKMCVPTNARNSRQQMAVHLIAPVYATGPINEMGPVAGPSRQSLVSVFTRLDPHFDVNAQDIDGYTALHFASTASETETFNLIQCGADLNAKAFNLRTPLHCASRGRQSGIISMLLHFGKQSGKLIDINAADVDGRTPLHDACRSGRPESVSLLVAAGADIQREDKASNTPLMACAEFMEEDKVWSLMKTKRGQPTISTGISIQDPFRGTPAARDPTQLQPYRESFHQDATRVGVIAKMLIKAGADTDGARRAASSYRNGQLVAALHQESTANGKLWYGDFVENSLLMPSHNAAVILENYKSDGPINDTVRHVDHIDEATIDALLARGIDFTKPARDGDDGTPIAKIARLGMTELMDKIIEKAKLFDDPAFSQSVAEAVHAGYARVRPLLQVACARKVWNMGMVKLLVVEGLVDGNAHKQVKQMQNGRETGSLVPGSTSLHVLAEGDFWWQVEAVKYLIEKGAKVDALDENGKTPLEIASTQNKYHSDANRGFFKPQICEILLQLGADPNKTNAAGLSPLEKAGTDGEIIKILLKHGAGVNIGTNGVLMSAVNDGDVQTLKLYLENGADCNAPNTSAPLTYDSQSWRLPKIRYPLLMAALPREHGSWGTAKSTDMVNLLLDHGARVDVPVSDNELLLHYLFGNARTSALRPLIENPNIDFSIRDQNGRTVFMAACGSWIHSEAIQEWHLSSEEKKRLRAEYTPAWLLLADSELHSSSIDYLAVDNGGNHIIFWLLSKWNEEIAARLLQIPGVRALIGQKNNEGYSPLHRALQGRNMELCFQLMKDGDTDLLDLDPNGDTALHHLSRCINPTARYLLLMHKFISLGGDINARNQVGETAILAHLASGNQPDLRFDSAKHTDNFPLFIDNGADFSAAKNDGTTALHIVARRETSCGVLGKNAHGEVDYNARVFKRLIELGCDLLQEDEEGRTALDVAAAMGNDGILRLFQRKKTAE